MVFTKSLQRFDRDWKFKRDTSNPRFWLNPNDYTDEELDKFLSYALKWCEKKFGYNHNKEYRTDLEWTRNDYFMAKVNFLGMYDPDDNIIHLRVSNHRTIYNLCNTIIHEYIHYLQPRNWYSRYGSKYGYDFNPFEVEAFHLGDLYEVDCTHWVMEKMGWDWNDTPKTKFISRWDNARSIYARKGSTKSSRYK